MENLYLDLSEKEEIPNTRRKIFIIIGLVFVLFGLTGLIFEVFDNKPKALHIISPLMILINGLIFLLQTTHIRFDFLKCYVSISEQVIDFKLWGFGKKRQVKWSDVNSLTILKSKIVIKLQDKTEVLLKLNLMSNKTGFKIIDSIKGFSMAKQIDCKTM